MKKLPAIAIAVPTAAYIRILALQPGATGNVLKSINVISEYDESFCRKGLGNRFFSKSGFSG
jgi:hypothetical protein